MSDSSIFGTSLMNKTFHVESAEILFNTLIVCSGLRYPKKISVGIWTSRKLEIDCPGPQSECGKMDNPSSS